MNREDANANKKIESKHGTIPTNIVAYRDKEGKLQTSLPIQQSTLTKSKSLRSKISRRIHRFLPIIDWLPNYDVKKNILGDIVGGLTIGVLHTTQGIAYALLARVQPVYGLYTSFFPALIYAIFGTSRHASVGSFAIVALMCGMAVDRVMMNDQMQRSQNETLGMDANDTKNIAVPEYSAIEIASTIFTMQGIILLVAAICGLQFITKYFSDTLVSGFTTGAAVHVAVGQIKVVLGLNIKAVGNRHILKRISDIVMNIPNANICVVITSVCSMLFIYIGKEFIDPRVKRYSKAIQIPYELILMYFMCAALERYPSGMLPKPRLPRFELMPECLPDALAIAALSIAIHISMSKMLAKKLKYKIDAGQELYAYGLMGTISGLFLCYPSSTSMGRTLVSVASGSQTQASCTDFALSTSSDLNKRPEEETDNKK
ncbi:unnamed protein product [Anisakis simplex]|uniref:Sulfate_transp domain-containing protein n=1 Tax=Anisakis simplex TaxID=6269 RepID=A0A0M3JWL1_ANISI|nr:unnamed protein product [Anisakis simplex]